MENFGIETFGPWKNLGFLDKGGQSLIFLAEKTKLDGGKIPAAIRVMKPQPNQTPEMTELLNKAFAHEYEVLSKLKSAYIAPVLDFGLEPIPWIATELIPGVSLNKHLKRSGTLGSLEWESLARQLLMGLKHAHDRDVVHQDIKPANIMITDDQIAMWIDFSSASIKGIKDGGYDGTAGTPGYRAPERWFSGHEITERSDIFSLGVVLFEAAVGRLPWKFDFSTSDLNGEIGRWIQRVKQEKPDLDQLTITQRMVVSEMLSFEPTKRADTKKLLARLGDYQAHGATGMHRDDLALQPGANRKPKPPVKKNPANLSNKEPLDKSLGIWRYRNKWWFWVLALFSLGFAIVFGAIYFLYKEFSSTSQPLSDKSRKWLGIVLTIVPAPGVISWIMPLTWFAKTKKIFYLWSALLQLAIFGLYLFIYSTSPQTISSGGTTSVELPAWVFLVLMVNVAISLWTIKKRPKNSAPTA